MRSKVFGQTVRAVERHAADVAGERAFPAVNSQVLLQISRPAELPAADVAGERAFVVFGVCAHVTLHPVNVDQSLADNAGRPTSSVQTKTVEGPMVR